MVLADVELISPALEKTEYSKRFYKAFVDETRTAMVILFKDVVDLDRWTHTTKKIHHINANRPRSRIESVRVDNRCIVPYNSHFCQKYDCHVNVEVGSTVQSKSYLYKYDKGQDRATVVLKERGRHDGNDETNTAEKRVVEIKQYLDARYLSTLEACWTTFKYEMQNKYHHVH
ncbi:LOW QUALITY PROTEIN: Helitron helicase [Phytophthora megakarya]|uniref:Helitron helicase n=1 Tax=Phytophthora megakarya TaxID=4795 RepID=A0A225UNH5_9STRA|nr:LOW QUALITY PROTEIN: Helitron helicase [Phytophthora megakarya]